MRKVSKTHKRDPSPGRNEQTSGQTTDVKPGGIRPHSELVARIQGQLDDIPGGGNKPPWRAVYALRELEEQLEAAEQRAEEEADNAVQFFRDRNALQEQLEASVPRDFSISQQEEIVRLKEQLEGYVKSLEMCARDRDAWLLKSRSLEEQLEAHERMLRNIYDAACDQMDADGRGWISAAWVEDCCAHALKLGSWSTRLSNPAKERESQLEYDLRMAGVPDE